MNKILGAIVILFVHSQAIQAAPPFIRGVDFKEYDAVEKLRLLPEDAVFPYQETVDPLLVEHYGDRSIRREIFAYQKSILTTNEYRAFKEWYHSHFAFEPQRKIKFSIWVQAHRKIWMTKFSDLHTADVEAMYKSLFGRSNTFVSVEAGIAFSSLLRSLRSVVAKESPGKIKEALQMFTHSMADLRPFTDGNEVFTKWINAKVIRSKINLYRWRNADYAYNGMLCSLAIDCPGPRMTASANPNVTQQTKQHKPSLAPARANALPYPIVFMHGMAGRAQYFKKIDYWRDVDAIARSIGARAYFLDAPAIASSFERAQNLYHEIQAILEETGAKRVHLVGHSQGGLDARVLMGAFDIAHRVASLTTLSTPHHGTRAKIQDPIWTGMDFRESYIETVFNPSFPVLAGIPRISYGAVACANFDKVCRERFPDAASTLFIFWLFGTQTMELYSGDAFHGANDGAVPMSSARWGTFAGILRADHLDIIWGDSFDRVGFYKHIMQQLTRIELAR